MPDMLSQGDEREPSPRRRRLAALAVLVGAVTALIVTHLPHHQPAAARPPRPAASSGPPSPAVSGSAVPGQALPAEPDGILGRTLPWEAGLRLPVAGARPTWFSPATGRSQVIGGLPPAPSGYQFTRLGGGWAVQAGSAGWPGCANCAGKPLPVYYLADHQRSAIPIGVADDVAPGASASTLWLTTFPPGADLSAASGMAQEISLRRAQPRPVVRLPAGYVIDQGTRRGLLLAPAIGHAGITTYRLWQPGTAQAGRTFASVIAASAAEIAWAPRCSPVCRMQVLNLTTSRDTVVALPAGSSAANGAFSPDGGYLALQVSFSSGGDGGAPAMQLEVASVATGRLSLVPGTFISSDAMVGFGWPAGSDSLVAELSFTTKVQVAAWRPGAARLAVAVVRPPGSPTALIVG
ncbi:MAG TPA: hypothetical protein VIJ82_24055 [Streptosporangiaceae bacterium]|jgi:hypothetical protein